MINGVSLPSPSIQPHFTSQTQWQYERSFIDAMSRRGVDFRHKIISNGALHRFASGGRGNKDCWYVFYGMAGAFGDWSRDIHETWSLHHSLSSQDSNTLHQQIEKTRQSAEEETRRRHEATALGALEKWNSFSETGNSPYLNRKKVEAFGIRFEGTDILIPLQDTAGKLWSLQRISPEGAKRFLPGGRKKGCFHRIGPCEEGKSIYVTEGYATGASIYMSTHHTTVVAFDAGNLESVVEELKKTYPNNSIIIAGDDDRWKETNVGREKAEEIAQKYGCSVVFPTFKNTDSKPTDFNDLHVLEGVAEVSRQLTLPPRSTTLKAVNVRDLLSMDIQPRDMLLNPILPEQGLVMIHAPRGIGKTHVSLMIAYAVATGSQVFNGRWVSDKPNKVLFVDGEMPLVVMQERLAKIVNSTEADVPLDNNLLIITPDLQNQGISDLSTPEGQAIVEEHLKDVKLLILDNHSALCRRGRENESESWLPLQEWFLTLRRRGISVLLIHHSNKTGGQRGTSRKEDLLDTVISLRKPESYDPREGARFEVHYEKARGFYGEDAIPFEACLREENGKFTWYSRDIEDSQMDKVLSLKKEGLSQRNIADETGLSPATINRRLKEAKEKGLLAETRDTQVFHASRPRE